MGVSSPRYQPGRSGWALSTSVSAACPSQRVVDGLMEALRDERFEVRYQCGRALAHLNARHPELAFRAQQVYAVVERELEAGEERWIARRGAGRRPEAPPDPRLDPALRERADRGLDHVFTVLSLVLPRRPLKIARRALHTGDAQLRGTALEYLESVLPEPVRRKLWPLLEEEAAPPRPTRPREQVVAELLASSESIQLRLEALRRERESR